ncbi:hypothetical protein CHARACLAT_028451 [Characodon lateralis]|uniref:Uncharacterized protein n=1 Tax=Characodon lateralis TaxID=208331 RepID=A0ABU7D4E9_9TELE|nr:hypothetical protein [Characodon lateralis]
MTFIHLKPKPPQDSTGSVYLVPVAVGHPLLDVHGQHLAAERQALGLLDHLLVRRHCVVSHDDVTLANKHPAHHFTARQQLNLLFTLDQMTGSGTRKPHQFGVDLGVRM